MLKVVKATVVEGVEDQLALEPQQVERSRTIFGEERSGGGEVLAEHDLVGLDGSVLHRSMPLSKLVKRRQQVALLVLGAARLSKLVATRVGQHREAIPEPLLGVVPQPHRRLHDVSIGIMDNSVPCIRHGAPRRA